jgi:hypothetical protein
METSLQKMVLARDVMSDINFLIVEKHAVDSLDGTISSLSGLIMNEAIALGASMFVSSDLARQHVAKSGKSVIDQHNESPGDVHGRGIVWETK